MKRPLTNIAIFGAYSAIAEATARQLVTSETAFFLIGRDEKRLETVAQDLTVRGSKKVHTRSADLSHRETFEGLVDEAFNTLGKVDAVLLAHGVLPDQASCMASPANAYKAFEDNAIGHIGLLTLIANRLESQGSGTIGVITSVAGDRGRKSNYVYGAAKKMVSTFLEGLRHRLAPAGIAVVDVRPGFVDTPMTQDFEKGALWASPEKVASGIVKAMITGRAVAYVPGFWQIIMLVIRTLPKSIFNKLNF